MTIQMLGLHGPPTVDEWNKVTLREVASFSSGTTPSRMRHADFFEFGRHPWVKTMDLNNSVVEVTDECVTDRALIETSLKIQPVGSVLVAMYGGFQQIGRTGLLARPAAVNQAITAIATNRQKLLPTYLLYILNYRVGYWKTVASSSRKDPNITSNDVKAFPIELPEVAEQRVISDVLTDVDQLITQLDRLIVKKQAIKQGMMQQLLTGKTRLPGFGGAWSARTLGELGAILKGRGIKREDVRPSGIPCIRYGELYTTFRDYTSITVSFVTPAIAETALPIRSGDLLFAGSGETRDEIGMCVAYAGEPAAVAGGDIIVLRGSSFNSVYLALLTNTPVIARQKARLGQGDAVVHISSRALASIEVNLPSRDEQDAIARVIVDIDDEIRALNFRLSKARDVKQGMMQQLLTGRTRLPVQEMVP